MPRGLFFWRMKRQTTRILAFLFEFVSSVVALLYDVSPESWFYSYSHLFGPWANWLDASPRLWPNASIDAFDTWCLRKILRIPYTRHTTNETVRSITSCSPVSERVKCCRLKFFGHLAGSSQEEDHHRVVSAALRPPSDWRRPVGRPKTLAETNRRWRSPQNYGVHTAWREAVGQGGLATSRQYGNALLGVRYQEEEEVAVASVGSRCQLSSAISHERQSVRMSKITNDGLIRSNTGCFIAVLI